MKQIVKGYMYIPSVHSREMAGKAMNHVWPGGSGCRLLPISLETDGEEEDVQSVRQDRLVKEHRRRRHTWARLKGN